MQGTAGSPCGLAAGWDKAAVGVVRARELQPTGWKRGTLPSEQEPSHLTLCLGCWSRSPSPTGETPPAPWLRLQSPGLPSLRLSPVWPVSLPLCPLTFWFQ